MKEASVLVLFSDGVTEACSPAGEEFGDERLLLCVKQERKGGAARIIEAIRTELATFTAGSRASDDTTLVAVCRLPLIAEIENRSLT